MSIKPSDIIRASGSNPDKFISKTNPLGRGFLFGVGHPFVCSGPDRHLIMTLLEVPLDGREAGVVPSERADEAKWELDPAQESMSADDAVCQICSQPIVS